MMAPPGRFVIDCYVKRLLSVWRILVQAGKLPGVNALISALRESFF
jgi:hypothetical protein